MLRLKIPDASRPPKTNFSIVIPAHNEELLLARLLGSIKRQQYPAAQIKTIVVADNCSDKTPIIASENGATVLTRNDDRFRGKGYAIKFALEKIDLETADAVFIIDADSMIKDDILMQLDAVFRSGKKIIQCYNGLANPDESWFTRLLDISRTVGNEIYHPAKQKLGLSSYLMGNGMCFSSEILKKYGWDAFSVGEDWEYYAKLIQAGESIAFANKARVYHQESHSLKQATSQRMRWSSGRFAVAGKYGVSLFLKGLKERNIKKIDASLPLLLPNPSLGINIIAVGFGLSFMLPAANEMFFSLWFLSLLMLQFLLFMTGIAHTRKRLKNFLSLFIAPLFLVWKMVIDVFSLMGMGRDKWVRTERK